ncbi:deleted [Thermacetogenium phaeum DSM 12270]|jgi:hypothetical protein|uniref:Deleted n=1 Tax=Thermacetogenium phaeum (strain ATCC BAA-254 / DSM 26808 / PB) TaxID=1089553 RepID=K4LKD0_THEPS|nr:hypothetical protein [Thermacetogenium phaeum]AFV12410.1 deleted [Thermacetogenium phaeum DSM 12270]
MTGVWQDYVRRVLRLDEEEVELWRRIAGMVPADCGAVLQMMIQSEREEMEALRSLLREEGVCDPDERLRPPVCPPYPGYDPGYRPGYRPDYKHDPVLDPIPYTEKDKEGK